LLLEVALENRVNKSCAALAAGLLVSSPASAEEFLSFLSGEWLVTAKANLVASPAYPGSSRLSVLPFPSLSVRRSGSPETFSSPDDTISFALYDIGWLKAGPAGRFLGARDSKDHAELTGLRKVDWTAEAGGFVEYWPVEKIRTRLEVRYGFHGHRGIVTDAGVDWVERKGAWTISAGPRLRFGSARFMSSYFGVTVDEAAANRRIRDFDAKGGLASAGLAAAVSYKWNEQWSTALHGRLDRLTGDAARSPITSQLGSRNQFTVGANIAYTFPVTVR
jgi:outer membrane scaffolding protein for murein synthesis (MipA/OmpV family)